VNYDLKDPKQIKPGDKLMVPLTFHVAQEGETWASVAKRTGINPDELKALNVEHGGDLQPGHQFWAPAAIYSPEVAKTRQGLMEIMKDAAEADSRLLYGPGQLTASSSGNYLGWGDGGETSSFLFSDDYRAVQQQDEGEESPLYTPLESPVDDMRKSLSQRMIDSVGWQAYSKAQEKNPNVQEPKREPQADGQTKYTFYDEANKATTVYYDPKNDGMMAFNDGPGPEIAWVGDASMPTKVVEDLSRFLGLSIPVWGVATEG
jgi:hypothetical protein